MVGMKGLNKLQFTNTEPGTISRSIFFVRKLVVDVINIEINSIASGSIWAFEWTLSVLVRF